MLPRFLLNLMILNLSFLPTNLSRFFTGFVSIWLPGKNAFTPMSTERPPFTFAMTVPSTSWSFSQACEISSQARMISALSFERSMKPFSISMRSR